MVYLFSGSCKYGIGSRRSFQNLLFLRLTLIKPKCITSHFQIKARSSIRNATNSL